MTEEQIINITKTVETTLQPLTLYDKINVLGQTMIGIGVRQILRDFPELVPQLPYSPAQILDLVTKDKQKQESLGGALAHQGLLMLMWLETGESNATNANSRRQARYS